MIITELQVRVTDSQPTGSGNQVFPPGIFAAFNNHNNGNSQRGGGLGFVNNSQETNSNFSANWGKNRQFGRGAGAYVQKKLGNGIAVHTASTRGRAGGSQEARLRSRKNKNQSRKERQQYGGVNQDIENNYQTDDDGVESEECEGTMDVE